MAYEILSQGNSMHRQIMETGNDIRALEAWIEGLKKDAAVVISSKDKPEEWSIIDLNGTEVLHLVERRLIKMKEHLKELNAEFDSL